MLDLISRNAGDAYGAATRILAERRTAKRLCILASLGRHRLGGTKARPVVHRLAEDLASPSGSFPAFLGD